MQGWGRRCRTPIPDNEVRHLSNQCLIPALVAGNGEPSLLGPIHSGGGAGSFRASPSANPVGLRRSGWFANTCAPTPVWNFRRSRCCIRSRILASRQRCVRRPHDWRRGAVATGNRRLAGTRARHNPTCDCTAFSRRPHCRGAPERTGAGEGRDLCRERDHPQAISIRGWPRKLQGRRI
jgi:hypothetical protein